MEASQTQLIGIRRKPKNWRKQNTSATKTTGCCPEQERPLLSSEQKATLPTGGGGTSTDARQALGNSGCGGLLQWTAKPILSHSCYRKEKELAQRAELGWTWARTCLIFFSTIPQDLLVASCCQKSISSPGSPQSSKLTEPGNFRSLSLAYIQNAVPNI